MEDGGPPGNPRNCYLWYRNYSETTVSIHWISRSHADNTDVSKVQLSRYYCSK